MSQPGRHMQFQNEERPIPARKTAVLPAGKLLFALALTSYVFWLGHSFAVRYFFNALHQLWSRSGVRP
jgi:hypothetical protein